MFTELEALIQRSNIDGWATGTSTLEQIQQDASALGLTIVPARKGDPLVATLRPHDSSTAHPNSLSAKYGTGAQPLHTDGAHLMHAPDIVVLLSRSTNNTATRLLRPENLPFDIRNHLKHGIFLVGGGKESFFATSQSHSRLRYDPGCMLPCDERARKVVQYFDLALAQATDHLWDEPNKVLVIDTQQTLHARASATHDQNREIQRVNFRRRPGT